MVQTTPVPRRRQDRRAAIIGRLTAARDSPKTDTPGNSDPTDRPEEPRRLSTPAPIGPDLRSSSTGIPPATYRPTRPPTEPHPRTPRSTCPEPYPGSDRAEVREYGLVGGLAVGDFRLLWCVRGLVWFSGGGWPCLRRWRSSFGPRCAGWSLRWLVPPTRPFKPQAFPSSLALLRDLEACGPYATRPSSSLTLLGRPLRSRPYGTHGSAAT